MPALFPTRLARQLQHLLGELDFSGVALISGHQTRTTSDEWKCRSKPQSVIATRLENSILVSFPEYYRTEYYRTQLQRIKLFKLTRFEQYVRIMKINRCIKASKRRKCWLSEKNVTEINWVVSLAPPHW